MSAPFSSSVQSLQQHVEGLLLWKGYGSVTALHPRWHFYLSNADPTLVRLTFVYPLDITGGQQYLLTPRLYGLLVYIGTSLNAALAILISNNIIYSVSEMEGNAIHFIQYEYWEVRVPLTTVDTAALSLTQRCHNCSLTAANLWAWILHHNHYLCVVDSTPLSVSMSCHLHVRVQLQEQTCQYCYTCRCFCLYFVFLPVTLVAVVKYLLWPLFIESVWEERIWVDSEHRCNASTAASGWNKHCTVTFLSTWLLAHITSFFYFSDALRSSIPDAPVQQDWMVESLKSKLIAMLVWYYIRQPSQV